MSLIKKIDSYFNHAGYTTIDGLSYSADSLFVSAKSNSNILIARIIMMMHEEFMMN